ncbi:MAG TPA: non-canonical purine NTP pyrophosphatase [Candidatus Binataceae bacterium]|nr:non-canonical purine NTP pyrophosphatase [Candidatus Binataceae bacterium]
MDARLLIATTNPAKLSEYRLLLAAYPLRLISLRELGIEQEPEETGAGFIENALIKARYYFELARISTLADDGGLEVDALGGAPGVHSHRWLGPDADDATLAEEIVRRMAGVPEHRRGARIRCALALAYEREGKTAEAVVEAAIEGVIAHEVYRPVRAGFPYRAVLYLPARGCYLAQLGEQEEARIGQRRTAVERADPYLREIVRMSRAC